MIACALTLSTCKERVNNICTFLAVQMWSVIFIVFHFINVHYYLVSSMSFVALTQQLLSHHKVKQFLKVYANIFPVTPMSKKYPSTLTVYSRNDSSRS